MRLLATLLVLLGISSVAAAEDAAAIWAALRGGHVALVRHAGTVGGFGDPPGFKLEDCATQRNLTDKGRAQARALGARFRAEGVAVGKVLSSQWCRCRETAALMGLDPIEPAPTFNNAFTFRDRVDELTAGARAIVAAWSGPGTLVVIDARRQHLAADRCYAGGGRHGGGEARPRDAWKATCARPRLAAVLDGRSIKQQRAERMSSCRMSFSPLAADCSPPARSP
jgi:hypothetical protein